MFCEQYSQRMATSLKLVGVCIKNKMVLVYVVHKSRFYVKSCHHCTGKFVNCQLSNISKSISITNVTVPCSVPLSILNVLCFSVQRESSVGTGTQYRI